MESQSSSFLEHRHQFALVLEFTCVRASTDAFPSYKDARDSPVTCQLQQVVLDCTAII